MSIEELAKILSDNIVNRMNKPSIARRIFSTLHTTAIVIDGLGPMIINAPDDSDLPDPPTEMGSYYWASGTWEPSERQPFGYRMVDGIPMEIFDLHDIPQPGFIKNPRRIK